MERQQLGLTESKVEVITIHPSFVMGPPLIPDRNSTVEAISKFARGEIPGLPAIQHPMICVRDVAQAHYLATFKSGIGPWQRFQITREAWPFRKIASHLDENYRDQGYKIRPRNVGYCPMKLAACFD